MGILCLKLARIMYAILPFYMRYDKVLYTFLAWVGPVGVKPLTLAVLMTN